MPIVVGRDCIGKNLQWERSNRLAKAVVPKSIAESREKERSGFAAHASESEQNPSDDAFRRGFHHDVHDRFPPADTQGKRGFAITIWHEQNDLFCRAQDQRDHDETEGEATSVGREAFETQDNQTVNNHTPGD